jgi:D-alanyl-lipoteichoic acid acyltransferase DltB (MBOAT superfamily)
MSIENVENTRVTAPQFLVVLAELGLVLLAAYLFHIEERHSLPLILPVIFLGFAVHAWLPPASRPAFFLALSIVCIGVVLGVADGLWLIGVGAVLFALCHLPGAWGVGCVLVFGALLALARLERIPVEGIREFGIGVLPLLAAMFMFRIVIYLHDLRHEQKPVPLAQRLAYFFMLPNICFPLFPVVDYRNFVREYYSAPAIAIYQKGLRWIMRGIVHLLLYRLIYYHLTPSFQEVTDLRGVVQYVVSSYLLYLRVSGMFHIVVGILCLFGYNLSETHRLYFLASSFTDFWRRINIYWKDFVMKVLYYPLFMRLRKLGMTQAVMLASLAILICSWLLHSYQTFWLQAVFPLTVQDAVFWSSLGIAVAVNAALEMRGGRARARSTDRPAVGAALLLSAKTVAMFCVMSLLWSFWSTGAVNEWFAVMEVAGNASLREILVLCAVIAGLIALGTLVQLVLHRGWVLSSERQWQFGRAAATTGALALVAIAASSQGLGDRLSPAAHDVWISLTSRNTANVREQEMETRGYYEELLGAETAPQAVWTLQGAPLVKRYFSMLGIAGLADAVQGTGDIRRYELRPSVELSYKGAAFHTNRWGMRDRDYAQAKQPGICRMLLFGDSHTMGSGVPDGATFEAVLEQRLNRELPIAGCGGFEILNFGVAGYSAVQSAFLARKRVPEFGADVVIYATAQPDLLWAGLRLSEALAEGSQLDEPALREIVDRAGINARMSQPEILQRLTPVQEELIRWAYHTFVETAARAGARPVWLFLPRFDLAPREVMALHDQLASLAEQAGLITLSVAEAYEGMDPASLQVAPWDKHPNVKADGLIAERLLRVLVDNQQSIFPPEENRDGS